MDCAICGERLLENAKFCSHCGNAVVLGSEVFVEKRGGVRVKTGLIKCPDCGHAVSDDALQCPSCGKIIGRPALQRAREEAERRRDPWKRMIAEGERMAAERERRIKEFYKDDPEGLRRWKRAMNVSKAIVLISILVALVVAIITFSVTPGFFEGLLYAPIAFVITLLCGGLVAFMASPADTCTH